MAQATRLQRKRPFALDDDEDDLVDRNGLEIDGDDDADDEEDFDVQGIDPNGKNLQNTNISNPAKRHTSFRRPVDENADIIEDHILEAQNDSSDENNDDEFQFHLIEENLAPSEDEDGNPIPIFKENEPIITQSLHEEMQKLSISGKNNQESEKNTNNDNDKTNNDNGNDNGMDLKMDGDDDIKTRDPIETVLDLNWESSDDEMQSHDNTNNNSNNSNSNDNSNSNSNDNSNNDNKNASEETKNEGDENETKQEVWLPNSSAKDGEDSKYEYDQSAYNVFHQFNTEWPCLTFDFIKDNLGAYRTRIPHSIYLACGTQANPNYHNPDINTPNVLNQNKSNYRTQNKVLLLKLSNLQKTKYDMDETDENEINDKEYADITDDDPVLQDREILHKGGCVNRLRCHNKSRPNLISTWCENGSVYIWDADQHIKSLDGRADNLALVRKDTAPVFETKNLDEGFGLAWSVLDEGKLLTGSCAGELCLYQPKSGTWIRTHKFKTPKTSIEDIAWSRKESNIFATASVDKCIRIFDTRPATKCQCVSMVKNGHSDDINVISWNPIHKHLLLSGSDDHSFKVWDLRKFPKAAKKKSIKPHAHYKWHTGAITTVDWCPHDASTCSASGEDNQISIWDLSLEQDNSEPVRGAQLPKDMKIPPQLVFVHAGQTDIKEVKWHPQIPNMMVSSAGSGFHIFQPDNLVEAMDNLILD